MPLSVHQIAVPAVVRALGNLRSVLQKGEAHAVARNTAPEALLQARLVYDMHPLVRQVQAATDTAKNGIARLAAVEPLRFDDTETTFAELYARIDRAREYIGGFEAVQLVGGEARAIAFKSGRAELRYESGLAYLSEFLLPNFYFHCTTAYDILRANGVELGKRDYLGLTR